MVTPPPQAGGVTAIPPPTPQPLENPQLFETAPDVPFDSKKNDIDTSASIDTDPLPPEHVETLKRIYAAKPRDFPPEMIKSAAAQLGHLRRKLGRDSSDQWCPNPDPSICAQFLAIAKWPILADFIGLVLCDRIAPGRTNAWWITVAIEKIHGITPDQQRAFRQKSRPRPQLSRAPTPPAPEKTRPGEPFETLVNELAQAKAMNRR